MQAGMLRSRLVRYVFTAIGPQSVRRSHAVALREGGGLGRLLVAVAAFDWKAG